MARASTVVSRGRQDSCTRQGGRLFLDLRPTMKTDLALTALLGAWSRGRPALSAIPDAVMRRLRDVQCVRSVAPERAAVLLFPSSTIGDGA